MEQLLGETKGLVKRQQCCVSCCCSLGFCLFDWACIVLGTVLAFTVAAEKRAWVTYGWASSCGVSLGADSACLGPVARCYKVTVAVALVALGYVSLTMKKLKVPKLMVVKVSLVYKCVGFS